MIDMIKAVLFDLDNTLINFSEFKERATKAAALAMEEKGLQVEKGDIEKRLIDFYYRHGIESDDAFKTFIQKTAGEVEYPILAAGVNAYLKEKYNHLEPFDGTKEVLNELMDRGIKLGVVSDGYRLKAWMRLVEAGIDEYFDCVVTFDDTKKLKPNKEPFLKACNRLDVKPEQTAFIGDWPERDIKGASNVGMLTVLALYGGKKGKADYVINDIREVLEILEAENH